MALVCAALLLVACRADGPGLPSGVSNSIIAAFAEDGERLDVCHLTESGKQVIDVSTSAWNAHRLHGDYALAWQVAHDNIAGDGIQFTRISDALDAADSTRRANGERTSASCRITISVAAGNYVGSYSTVGAALERLPFFIGVPDVTLRGASVMQMDGDARATGLSEAGISTIAPDRGLTANEALIVVADDMDGYHGYGAVIQGFRFTSGYDPTGTASGGIGVGSLRVRDLRVVGNQFEATMLSAVSIRASRAVIDGNYARGLGALCGFCLTGPGHFEVTSNRLIDGGFVGIFLAPVSVLPIFSMGRNERSIVVPAFVVPLVAAETAVVVNNEVRDHVRQPRGFGTGIRLG